MLRIVTTLLISTLPAFAMDPYKAGHQVERFEVPNVFPCPDDFVECHGLQYTIKLNEPSCLRWNEIFVVRPNGKILPIKVVESGTPGLPGYELNLYVDDSGPMLVHFNVVDTCSQG